MERWWWCLWLIIIPLISNYAFQALPGAIFKLLNLADRQQALSDQNYYKTLTKFWKAVYYFFVFTMGTALFASDCNWISKFPEDRKPNYMQDKLVKLSIVMITTTFCLDFLYFFQWMKWHLILHHIVAFIIMLDVYDAELHQLVPFIGRDYVVLVGYLLSMLWVLNVASLNYYLGDPSSKKQRLALYALGLASQLIFTFAQVTLGMLMKLHTVWNLPRVVVFIVLQCGILPTQIASIIDIYQIMTKKILYQPMGQEDVESAQDDIEETI